MSNPSSGGFGIGTVIFLVILYNVIFDDDDDKKEVDIIEQDTIVQTTPAPKSDIQESLNKVKDEGVILLKKLKDKTLSVSIKVKDKAAKEIKLKKEEMTEKKESVINIMPTPVVPDDELKIDPSTPIPVLEQLNEKSNESDDTMIKL